MKITTIIALISTILFTACKKNNTGGNVTVNISTAHHGKPISFTKVYIKYGASEFPGFETSAYNTVQTTDVDGKTTFSNLLYGDYYFFGEGYDTAVQATVRGGIKLSVPLKQRKNNFTMDLPITE